jgi:hypothetical protein
MKRPAGRKGRSPDADRTPPGGRALERVQQDRLARGLPPAEVPGTLSVEDDPPAASRPRGGAKARKASKTRKTSKTRKAAKTRKTAKTAKTARKSAKKAAKKGRKTARKSASRAVRKK